jgi:3-methyladenine DNA glycosylase AlkD
MAAKKSTTAKNKSVPTQFSSKLFVEQLTALRNSALTDNSRFFKQADNSTKYLGIRMANIFALARNFTAMPVDQIEHLLDSDYYEARMGAVSIMDFQARDKKVTAERRKQLFDLYINKHDRINNWDLVDRSAPYVLGGYLFDKPRAILYKLAKSKNIWERRSAIVATYFFIRQNEVDDTFKIAELLLLDKQDLVAAVSKNAKKNVFCIDTALNSGMY